MTELKALPTLLSKKTIQKLGSTTNEAVAGNISSFARKQMEKMGWKDGQGLGKNGDGIVKHIKIDKKADDGGVGIDAVAAEQRDQQNVWWHDAFAGKLNSFDIGKKKKKKDKSKDPATTPETEASRHNNGTAAMPEMPSFDELFKATGGARLGMRARRAQKGKWERADDDGGRRAAPAVGATAGLDEEALKAAKVAKKARKALKLAAKEAKKAAKKAAKEKVKEEAALQDGSSSSAEEKDEGSETKSKKRGASEVETNKSSKKKKRS